MGLTGSKPKLCQVAPFEAEQPIPHSSLHSQPDNQLQQTGYVEQRRTVLPPIKQQIRPEPFFPGPLIQSNNSSIIHSHPPIRPLSLVQSDERIFWFSTAAQARQPGTTRTKQGWFPDTQTDLTQKAYRSHKNHLRQAREQRRHKVFYSYNDQNDERNQPLKLVSRPTQRDIFWDNTTGERLDPSCLLE